MKIESETNEKIAPKNSCPHLGLSDDPKTFSAYPSEWNVCHCVRPSSTPNFQHQERFCLSPEFTNCEIYSGLSEKMPKNIQHISSGALISKKKNLRIAIIFSIVAVLLITAFVVSNLLGFRLSGLFSKMSDTSQSDQIDLPRATQTLFGSPTQTNPAEISPTPTDPLPTPTESISPTPTEVEPVLALDTPIGDEYQYIIHRVEEGESLQIFADKHKTTIDAIIAVNYNLIAPLWIDWLIVIPENLTDVEGLPTFEPYQVEAQSISINELSDSLLVPLDDLLLYNDLDTEHVLEQGEWLLIPRESASP